MRSKWSDEDSNSEQKKPKPKKKNADDAVTITDGK